MAGRTVEDVGEALATRLCRDDAACVTLCTYLVRLLGEGRPVSREQLGEALHWTPWAVKTTLRHIPGIEVDAQGRIVAAGLSLLPTPHQFQVNGHLLYTWCAVDTLMYPTVLQQSAVVASRCPVSGAWVRLTVTPERVTQLDPAAALVCVVVPDADAASCDVRGAFCHHVHFLAGAEAGTRWQVAHPEAVLLTVEDAHRVARRLARTRYRLDGSP